MISVFHSLQLYVWSTESHLIYAVFKKPVTIAIEFSLARVDPGVFVKLHNDLYANSVYGPTLEW